jgi:diguanylate cyclase (GGDEF)-like protein
MGDPRVEAGLNMMPGDDILFSIAEMMDTIRDATDATGIFFATQDREFHHVEICRSYPRIFLRGDRLTRIRAFPEFATTSYGRQPILATAREAPDRTSRRALESELYSVGPVKVEVTADVEVRGVRGIVNLFSTHAELNNVSTAPSLVKLLALHIEASFILRSELEGVAHKLDTAEVAASRDTLTGLHNRRGFNHELEREQRRRRRRRYLGPVTVGIFDLDGLKTVNDRYGHSAGDALIKRFAQILNQASRTIDITARLGGDEFALMAPQTGPEAAAVLRERLRTVFSDAGIEVSMGFATNEDGTQSTNDLVILADAKMYQEKRQRHDGRHTAVRAG